MPCTRTLAARTGSTLPPSASAWTLKNRQSGHACQRRKDIGLLPESHRLKPTVLEWAEAPQTAACLMSNKLSPGLACCCILFRNSTRWKQWGVVPSLSVLLCCWCTVIIFACFSAVFLSLVCTDFAIRRCIIGQSITALKNPIRSDFVVI